MVWCDDGDHASFLSARFPLQAAIVSVIAMVIAWRAWHVSVQTAAGEEAVRQGQAAKGKAQCKHAIFADVDSLTGGQPLELVRTCCSETHSLVMILRRVGARTAHSTDLYLASGMTHGAPLHALVVTLAHQTASV